MLRSRKKRRRKAKRNFAQRLFRSFLSIVILTAFVLGISLFVKEVSTLQAGNVVAVTRPLFNKLGVSSEVADTAGEVAGDFAKRVLNTNIAPSSTFEESQIQPTIDSASVEEVEVKDIVLKVALLSDSEDNLANLAKALVTAKDQGVSTLFFLGDYTAHGVVEDLESAKALMDASGFEYYSIPGDHDLYDTVGPDNFIQVFGDETGLVTLNDVTFLLIDNSANFTPISSDVMGQYMTGIDMADFVLLSQPLYFPNAAFGKSVMGMFEGEIIRSVKNQADELLSKIQSSNVRSVVAADHHSFSRLKDPVNSNLDHIVLGSVTNERADRSRTSITVLSVYEDGSYDLEEVLFE